MLITISNMFRLLFIFYYCFKIFVVFMFVSLCGVVSLFISSIYHFLGKTNKGDFEEYPIIYTIIVYISCVLYF